MGSWYIDALGGVKEKARNMIAGNYQTAIHVLIFCCCINKIFLQDSAAMLILQPDRMESSPLFKVVPVFRNSLFLMFLDKMKLSLETVQEPVDSLIDAVVPGLMKWQQEHLMESWVINPVVSLAVFM